MRFNYCPDCGQKLTEREVGDEGMVPWCEHCNKPWFDMFPTCIIALVYNKESKEVVLLKQNYISTQYRNLVSGYMKPGETAETTAVREIEEEIGLRARSTELVGTWWFAKKQMLMVGFMVEAEHLPLHLSSEVDAADWVPASEALPMVHPAGGGSTSHALVQLFIERQCATNDD